MTKMDWNWFYNYMTGWLLEIYLVGFGNNAWKNEVVSKIKIMIDKYENDVRDIRSTDNFVKRTHLQLVNRELERIN